MMKQLPDFIKPVNFFSILFFTFGFSLFAHLGSAQNDAFIANHTLSGGAVTWKMTTPVAKGFMMLGDSTWARTDTAGGILSAKSYSLMGHSFAATLFTHYLNRSLALVHDSANSFILLKLDSNGNKIWSKRYLVSSYNVTGLNLSANKHTHSYLVTGGLAPLNNSTVYGFIMRTDTAGNIDTTLMVKGDSAHSNYCQGVGPVLQGSDGSYYFTLNGFLLGNPNPLLILKTDSLLNFVQCKEFPAYTPGDNGILLDGNNIFIASATNNGFNVTYPTFLEINNLLNLTHSLVLTTPASGSFNSIRHTSDSGLVAAGWVLDAARGNNGVPYIAKTNSLVDSMWTATYPTLPQTPASTDATNDIIQTKTGYLLAGSHLIKTGLTGNTPCHDSTMHASTGLLTGLMNNINMTFYPLTIDTAAANITASAAAITTAYACYNRLTAVNNAKDENPGVSVYPNPSNGIFTVQLSDPIAIGISNKLSVEVYNVLGEKVTSFSTFHSQFAIDLTKQPAGLYLYRLLSENGALISAGKLIIK